MPQVSKADRQAMIQAGRELKGSQTRESIEGGRRLLYNLRHKSAAEVTKAMMRRKEGAAKAKVKAGRDKVVWEAGDYVLRDSAYRMEGEFAPDVWDERRRMFTELVASLRTSISAALCKVLGHTFDLRHVYTKYEAAQSPWERAQQAVDNPYQYFHRCSRFGCKAEKPR